MAVLRCYFLITDRRFNGQLIMSIKTLLTEMPYQLNEVSPLCSEITQSMTSILFKSNQAIYVMNLVKQQENQAAFQFLHKSQKDAQTLVSNDG